MSVSEWWPQVRAVIIVLQIAFVVYEVGRFVRARIAKKPAVNNEKDAIAGRKTKQLAGQEGRRPSPVYAVDFTTSSNAAAASAEAVPLKPRKLVNGKAGGAKRPVAEYTIASVDTPTTIFYSTLTGSSERYANRLKEQLSTVLSQPIRVANLDYLDDLDEFFVTPKPEARGSLYLFVVPSYETESPLDWFIEHLRETYNDFRIDSAPLRDLAGFSVFGIGDTEGWPDEKMFCYQARQVDKLLGRLGGRRVFPMGTGCVKTSIDASFAEYVEHLTRELRDPTVVTEIALEDLVDSEDEEDAAEVPEPTPAKSDVMDVEDMGASIARAQPKAAKSGKEMVAKDSPTFKSLTKQGYTVVGSHSGVKICRWTKSALRGRGSCYKFAFYGIRSHLCMETTPSLSCSNKCVFCWRHGTNPVGTTWRWQVDPPKAILDGALAGHYRKIKEMRGVPGIQAARFAEAFRVRHCALSLVGEPIFYPHINEFLEMLHAKQISSFLVCNAQHPAELAALKRVTQLYVSIDASDKESLRRVDRPLHRDFWERLEQCLDIIRQKSEQRTVYRLTLVKGFNADDVVGYADMIERGRPCFVEVKGVTFCGTSSSNTLRMSNVPFYDEVLTFVTALDEELKSRNLDYGLATEHAHSCCVLLAQNRFKVNGRWHTHIDYTRFFELLESGQPFGPMDYIAETPEFAWFGSAQAGFNPEDVRHRKGKPIEAEE